MQSDDYHEISSTHQGHTFFKENRKYPHSSRVPERKQFLARSANSIGLDLDL